MTNQTSLSGMEEHDLEDQALSQLNATHYKEAISLFKKLLQTADNEEWRQKLAYCYVQRATQFAAKGMYKEAVVLWENHLPFSQAPYDANDQYIFWLIQINNQANIKACLSELSAQQLDKQYPTLAVVLGLLMLTEHPEFEQILPQDSVLIAHFKIVKVALQAYQDNDYDKLAKALKLIPYRSAFRDFRTLLNAVVLIPTSVEQARSHLSKISSHSVYFQTVEVLLVCTAEGAELAEELIRFSHQQCAVIGAVKGFSKKQLELMSQFTRQHDKLTDKVQLKMAIQFKSLLGTDLAKHFCQGILTSYPAGKKEFKKQFGGLDKFEETRIKALICERDNELYDAESYWRDCFDMLDDSYADNSLKRALILRRMASKEPDEEGRITILEESLDYDPDDHQSYLQILQYYGQQSESAKDYNKWLTRTLKQFPQDVEILTQAVKTATRNKSYTKASQYAYKILKIDPINTFAKQTLFSEHLAKARQLISKKTYHAVEKEISQAEKLNVGKAYIKKIQFMRSLLCFANEDKQQGLQRIIKELNVLHTSPVNGHFHAAMEAMLCGLPVATILRELKPVKGLLLSAQELTELIQQLEQYAIDEDNRTCLYKALEKIKDPLKNSLSEQKYAEELFINLCKVLDSFGHFELIRHCVKSIPLKWNKPVWKYYRVYADTNGDAGRCSHRQVRHLQDINDEAREAKEYQTGSLIDKYLEYYYDAHPQQGMNFLDELFGGLFVDDNDDDDYLDPMEELFGHLDEDLLSELNDKAELIMKKQRPEQLILGIMKKIRNKEIVLMAVMQNPDILSVLMILKAADELKVDIDVDIDDVMEVFEINETGKSSPFPF